MTWALQIPSSELQGSPARHVLLCLANYAGTDGRAAFPSVATLAEDTGLSERTVRSKLDELEAAGWISRGNQAIAAVYIDRRDRRPVVYDLQMVRGASVAPRHERGAADGTGCSSQQNGVQLTTERGAGAAPNPSLNQSTHSHRTTFELTLDWEPDPKRLAPYAKRAGLTLEHFASEAIAGFVNYHEAKGLVQTEKQWLAALVSWIRRDLTKAANTAKASPSGTRQAAGPNFDDDTWAIDPEDA
jgi:hypothetical protein